MVRAQSSSISTGSSIEPTCIYFTSSRAREARLPAELALLPIVESAFDPFAYSHGRAAGLWQIIPGTGKRLGLAAELVVRRPARRARIDARGARLSRASARRVRRRLVARRRGLQLRRRQRRRAVKNAARPPVSRQDFWGIKSYLPAETRTYVPRLLAHRSAWSANPAAHGVTLPELTNEPRFAVVETGSQIDMALAAELAGIDTDCALRTEPRHQSLGDGSRRSAPAATPRRTGRAVHD